MKTTADHQRIGAIGHGPPNHIFELAGLIATQTDITQVIPFEQNARPAQCFTQTRRFHQWGGKLTETDARHTVNPILCGLQ